MKINRNTFGGRAAGQIAFSRIDLVVTVICVLVLGVLMYFGGCKWAAYSRLNTCKNRAAILGQAFLSYIHDHQNAIPLAGVRYNKNSSISWDTEIKSYVINAETSKTSDQREADWFNALRCPSDQLVRDYGGEPRSYSMPWHCVQTAPANMNIWPISSQNDTGVGMRYDFANAPLQKIPLNQTVITVSNIPDADTNEIRDAVVAPPKKIVKAKPKFGQVDAYYIGDTRISRDSLPEVKVSDVPDPANTIMLAESVASYNSVGGFPGAAVATTGLELPGNLWKQNYQGGKLTYLMVDGHVENMGRLAAGGNAGIAQEWWRMKGKWTIRSDD